MKKCIALVLTCILVLASLGTAAFAEKETIKVGVLTPLTGLTAANGVDVSAAMELWLETHDHKLGGFPVEIIVEDDEADASASLTKAQKLVEMDEVDIIIGPSMTAGLYSVLSYCEEMEVLLFTPNAAGDDATMLQASDYLVRSAPSSSHLTHPLADFAANELGLKKVALLGYDFLYGYETTGGFQKVFEDNGGQVIWKQLIPNNLTDYSSIISSIPFDEVDALVYVLSGGNAMQFAKQLAEYGVTDMDIKVLAGIASLEETFLSEISPECVGFYTSQNWHSVADGTNARKEEMMAAFTKKTGNIVSTNTAQYWVAMEILDQALAGVEEYSDAVDMVQKIRAGKYDTLFGEITFDQYGEAIFDVYIRELQQIDGQLWNIPVKTYESVSQFWTYDPDTFMNGERYSATYPPVK